MFEEILDSGWLTLRDFSRRFTVATCEKRCALVRNDKRGKPFVVVSIRSSLATKPLFTSSLNLMTLPYGTKDNLNYMGF